MLASLPDPVRGSFSLIVLAVNTLFWSLLLFLVALLKLVIPIENWGIICSKLLHQLAQNWVGCNNWGLQHTKKIHWDVQGIDVLKSNAWYLVVANHQSMVDIVVLQKIFHRKIPMLKFFLKSELMWVPILGIVWWVLDFPFMKRKSSTRGDLQAARKACEKFKLTPVSVMNFLEGTRFTSEKREKQNSPFRNLLQPKAAGIALVLATMGQQLDSILDVTIVYPEGVQDIWAFLCSRSMKIIVRVKQIPVDKELLGDYFTDRNYRRHFNNWLNTLWSEKDKLIGTLLQPPGQEPRNAEEA
jgi:1-acyl-sn-glycerol-3-phosphate acyltransferase